MKIVKAKDKDIDEILLVYDKAKEFMRNTGNPTQWNNGYPSKELLINDINNGNLYVGLDDKKICCVFAFIIGDDKCYNRIDDGCWLNDKEYGTIHRIASNGKVNGVFCEVLKFCFGKINNIRIDTHHDNKVMQHLILKNGFSRCGIVYMEDGSERIAYQRMDYEK